jgi:hypothetical protein
MTPTPTEPTFPATFTMHTPQGPTHACVKHARAVESLFCFLGAYVNATKAPDGSECASCVNEAADKVRQA